MKNIDVFCGVSSLGLPFPRENKNHIGYYDIVVSELENRGYNVSGFNFSRLNKNHTWDLEENLNSNRSLAYLKRLQIKSIEDLRNTNALFKIVVPKKYIKNIRFKLSDNNDTLKTLYENSKKPIFLYSGGPNDFFSYIKAGPVELLNQDVRDQLPEDINSLIEKCIGNVEQNWQLLHELNPNVKIYALSYYYSPLYDKIQKLIYLQEKMKNSNTEYVNKFIVKINLYNRLLEEASKKYDYVEYCDITFLKDYCATADFHPNTRGNELMANMLLEKIQSHLDETNKVL